MLFKNKFLFIYNLIKIFFLLLYYKYLNKKNKYKSIKKYKNKTLSIS